MKSSLSIKSDRINSRSLPRLWVTKNSKVPLWNIVRSTKQLFSWSNATFAMAEYWKPMVLPISEITTPNGINNAKQNLRKKLKTREFLALEPTICISILASCNYDVSHMRSLLFITFSTTQYLFTVLLLLAGDMIAKARSFFPSRKVS